VASSCAEGTITITISGGIAPYQYSINNGVTLTAPIYNTTYAFMGLVAGGVYNIYVRDNAGIVYRWTEIDCSGIYIEIIPIYLTPTASGFYRYFYDGPSYPLRFWDLTQGMGVTEPYGMVVEAVGNPAGGTTFLGWSYELADRFTINNISWITEDETLIYTFKTDNIKIYGYFIDNGPISLDLCFIAATIPSTISYNDKQFACTLCGENLGTTVTVYFDPVLYQANGIEGVTWYKDAALTTVVDNGYYLDGSQAFSTIYGVTTGIPINHGICDGESLECPLP